jgi:aryl-alcohol dehydrogenase-like predicted oxidoreductase
MRRNRLAGTPLDVSQIGFGCGKLASLSGSANSREAAATVAEACDRGINLFDTADMYGQGRAEEILGRTLGARRQSVVIATKAGYSFGSAAGLGARLKPLLRPLIRRAAWFRKSVQRAAGQQRQQNFSPAYLTAAIEGSLRRLRTDYIDLFLLHSPDPAVIDAAAWEGALEDARVQGKIRFYGVSCRAAGDAAACFQNRSISCVQIPVNLIERTGLDSMLQCAADLGVGMLARQPLCTGLLAKPTAELRQQDFPFSREEFEERLDRIRALPARGDSATACVQTALRYVLQLNGVGSVILGMSNREHLRHNLSAVAQAAAAPAAGKIL